MLQVGMTKHTFLPTTNMEASQKEYLIARKIIFLDYNCNKSQKKFFNHFPI